MNLGCQDLLGRNVGPQRDLPSIASRRRATTGRLQPKVTETCGRTLRTRRTRDTEWSQRSRGSNTPRSQAAKPPITKARIR